MKLLASLALLLLLSFFFCSTPQADAAVYPDVPPPSGETRTPNMMSFKAGSLVIDMGDHQIENTFVDDKAVPGLFNLYVYGFAVHLLHNGVPLFWGIKANKAKDAIDFSARTSRVHPTGPYGSGDGPWGSETEAVHAFKAGPLIVKQINAAAALTVLGNLKTSQSGGGRFNSIVIHRLAADTEIDIRHIILHKPHVFVSIISGDAFDYGPQSNLFGNIGLIQGKVENGGHYELVDNGTRIEDFNEGTCHTLFTEPHIIYDTRDDGSCQRCLDTVPRYREALFKFINAGGNFAAQCAGVTSYENSLWDSQYHPEQGVEGAFLSKYGIKGLGNKGNEWGGRSNDNSLRYPYPDLPVVQFVGDMAGNQTGTITEWYMLGSGTESSLFKNNGHSLVENSKTGQAFRNTQADQIKACGACGDTALNYLPDGRTAFVVSGAKVGTSSVGGMVFYLGSHSWWQALESGTSSTTPSGYVEYSSLYNGRRILLNAMLTPSTRPANCLLSICPEDFECPSKDLLGSCQRCECVNGEEVITTDPSMCGSCEQCIEGGCVRNDTLCGDCEDCGLNDEGHYWCYEITNENCTSGGGLTPEEAGAVAGAVIGAVLGAVLGAALAIIGAGVVAWKLLKKPPATPTIDGVQNMAETDADVNDNKIWDDPVKVFDSQL